MSKRILCALLTLSILALGLSACQITPPETSSPEQSVDVTTAVTTTVATATSDGTTVPTATFTTIGSTKTEGPTSQPTSKPSASTTAYTTTRPQITPLPITPTLFTTKNKTTTKTKSTVKTTTTEEGTRTGPTDPIIDLNGYDFKYANSWRSFYGESLYELELYDRAAEVQDALNCKISFTSFYPSIESLKTYKMSGKCPADVVEAMALQVYPAAAQGYLESLDPYIENGTINPADARWLQPYNKLGVSPLDGKQYGLRFMRPSDARYCVFYNKTLLSELGKDPVALYEAAYTGEWDLDMLRQYSIAVTGDSDSDGALDTWGIVGAFDTLTYSFALAGGDSLVTVQNGKATSNLCNDSAAEGLAFLDRLLNTDLVIYFPNAARKEITCDSALGKYDPVNFFLEGNTAFLFAEAWVAEQQLLPNAKFEYGLLPLPLGPGAEVYVSPSHHTRMSVLPVNNKSLETAILIFNELAKPLEDTVEDMAYVYYTSFQENDLDSLVMYYVSLEFATVDLAFSVSSLSDAFIHVAKRTYLWQQDSFDRPYENLSANAQPEIDAVFG